MMRYVLCILALLLSCACVHVLAEEVPAADLSDQVPDAENDSVVSGVDGPEGKLKAEGDSSCPDGVTTGTSGNCAFSVVQPEDGAASDCPPGKTPRTSESTCPPAVGAVAGGDEACSSANTGSNCGSKDTEAEAPPTECTEESQKENCPANSVQTKGNCTDDSNTSCSKTGKEPAPITPKEPAPHAEHSNTDAAVSLTPGTGSTLSTGSPKDERQGENRNQGNADVSAPSPAAPPAGEATDGPTAVEGQAESSNNAAVGTPQNKESAGQPPSTTSSTNTVTESVSSSDTSPGNDNTSAGTGSTNTQEGDVGNTDTPSTTTTTLPPELTNNKKGDADSSSSISSSVWVRVPLLIVMTLACILVC
ncbi:uncharacterized protein TM35_000521130 [Trypanosoma theileri]|uniref:Titin n=1 Tax=Trypanosoma theileri TaxID=67003 RepID=A0A1X0NIF8_9TRYP|nr:uncharacterized protein TM35_000521130 [Trypanosoma theileri]ORC83969.1 hypothetical protein TM35_000521130 [Trypanosoma theileri]